MIFTVGAVLFLLGYLWYRQAEFYSDWRDAVQFLMIILGLGLMSISLLSIAWIWLPLY
jgi:multisubunit Na+/H+ antiporter MnhB subunit